MSKAEDYDFLVPWCGDKVWWEPNYSDTDTTYSEYDKQAGVFVERPIEWKENKPFKAAFKAQGFFVSSSVARVQMKNVATDVIFQIREREFMEALGQLAVLHGLFIGEWIFRKTSGRYYGLKLYY